MGLNRTARYTDSASLKQTARKFERSERKALRSSCPSFYGNSVRSYKKLLREAEEDGEYDFTLPPYRSKDLMASARRALDSSPSLLVPLNRRRLNNAIRIDRLIMAYREAKLEEKASLEQRILEGLL